jgi:hypothetical protein
VNVSQNLGLFSTLEMCPQWFSFLLGVHSPRRPFSSASILLGVHSPRRSSRSITSAIFHISLFRNNVADKPTSSWESCRFGYLSLLLARNVRRSVPAAGGRQNTSRGSGNNQTTKCWKIPHDPVARVAPLSWPEARAKTGWDREPGWYPHSVVQPKMGRRLVKFLELGRVMVNGTDG